MKSLRFRALLCGTPAVLIDRGQLRQDVMRENRFTVDELLEELRIQGYCDLGAVKYAILENSGQLSILPWPREQPAAAKRLHQVVPDDTVLPYVLINDGRVLDRNLSACGKSRSWLEQELSALGYLSPKEVFLMTYEEQGGIQCLRKESAT